MLNEGLAVVLAIVNGLIAVYVLINARKMFQSKPEWLSDVFEDADSWLQNKIEALVVPDAESGMSFIDALGARLGQGFRMSLLAQKSANVRHEKMIETRVFDALKNNSPELKIGLQALDQLGLGDLATPENLPALLQVAQKYGIFGQFLGQSPNNGGQSPPTRITGNPFKVT